jgi:dTDP-glucose 4,6-dehydratase
VILVTGGAGFIGSNFVLEWLRTNASPVVNVDSLTYAGNLGNLKSIAQDKRHIFVRGDINDRALLRRTLAEHRPSAVVHFAAESHVDRSILGPGDFITTNVNGTFSLLEESRGYWDSLPPAERARFRFLHVSTDEVYGSLNPEDPPFSETTRYAPNSPYAASKAASDHIVRAYHHTYGFPALITNCSNNYGPYQFPEKLIPLMILNATQGKPLPVYGQGTNVREWLYVTDHCSAVRAVLARGCVGETYNIGSGMERTNIDIVRTLCDILDAVLPQSAFRPHASLITYVKDRPGHDLRYAIDAIKVRRELDWSPAEALDTGLRKTVDWYLNHSEWVRSITTGDYRNWIERNYAQR